MRGPSTEGVERVEKVVFNNVFATYSTTLTPFGALTEPNGSMPIMDVITEAEDGH